MSNTATPFNLPKEHRCLLPPARTDGLILADVKVRGQWDGILVIDDRFRCIGVYVGRQVINWTLPFSTSEIEDYRKACLWNRFLAFMPPILLSPYAAVWIGSPILIALGHFVSAWFLLTVPLLAVISIARMFSEGGFPLIRMPSVMAAIAFAALAVGTFAGKHRNNHPANRSPHRALGGR
ncbi:MAG: hypothetical protein V4710_09260 [Verrucomicrobiota bacterium]